ncbi:MAG: hypothetical protein A2W25_14915 [candidate division Zixibacteria bacterium RBG_16_53_22]|nr:MAG: hypothetical protein A2W25_14915 [candidate division Zixibacteria bacterium RBG_16_53_22]
MNCSNKNKAGNDKGVVLVVVMLLLLMLSLIGIASITTSTSDMTVAGNELNQTGAFYAAESGIEKAAAAIVTSFETNGTPPSPLPSGSQTQGAYQYSYSTVADGSPVQMTLADGAYRGLYGLVRKYNITSTGLDNSGESSVTLKMAMQDALIPLFQFAVFYQNDLEFSPSTVMTLGGRVHANGEVFLQSSGGLNINSYLTAAGNIHHGPKAGSGLGSLAGDVLIMDKNGAYQNMKNNDGTWLDASSAGWVNSSLSRWSGLVEDDAHGITQLEMPVVTDGPATDLIDRGAGNNDSFELKAGLKFVDGQVYYLSAPGTWTNVTAAMIAQGVITARTFYDAREAQDVYSLDIDVQRLTASGYYPSNGVIYASVPAVSGVISGVRLRNATTLPRATTFATDNPLYTVGNFNTVTKKPAAIMADAVTVLSSSWDDSRSTQPLGSRGASATQLNASFITGTTETGQDGHAYNGGLENSLRLLESWNNVTMTWRGSAVSLWYSRQATGVWSYGNYYIAPTRDWAFDIDLLNIANLPPGTPMVNIVQRTQWYQIFAAAQ